MLTKKSAFSTPDDIPVADCPFHGGDYGVREQTTR